MDDARDIAIANERDCRARRPDFLDQLRVAGPVQHAGRDFADLNALRFREPVEVLGHGQIQAHEPSLVTGADGDFLHINVGCVQKAAPLGDGQHRKRAWQRLRAQAYAFERIDGDVDLGAAPADSSPIYSTGTSSCSPSPMTTRPEIGRSLSSRRIARAAATSACISSPRPRKSRRSHRRGLGYARDVERKRAHKRCLPAQIAFP